MKRNRLQNLNNLICKIFGRVGTGNMFIQCHLPNNNQKFLLYDKNDFDVKEIGLELEDVEIIEPNKIMSEYDELPIMNLNDFLLRMLKPNERTTTHILGELGLDSFYQITHEKLLIDKKESKLSRSQRNKVLQRYEEIIKLITASYKK